MNVGPYTDIGANLLHKQFDPDREAVIHRARAAGIARILLTASNLDESAAAVTFCRARSDGLWCTAGVHPHHAKDVSADWLTRLAELLAHPEVKAVGETGLDFNRNFSPRDRQIEVFEAQLAAAAEIGKPVFVHDRDSQGEVFELLQRHTQSLSGVVVHCFTGSAADLARYVEAGFYIGITGWVCDERRGQPLRDLIAGIPLNRLLVETDAPFLRPHNVPKEAALNAGNGPDKRRNEPAWLPYIVEKLGQLYGRDAADIARASHDNASALFGLPDRG